MRPDYREDAITSGQGYDAMFAFLRAWWERGGRRSEDVGQLLADLALGVLWDDGGSTDPAMEHDWCDAVRRVSKGDDVYADL
jgi:hypothetical protein